MKEFKWFTIFDYEKEEEYLNSMHKKGWKFVKVSGLGMYHFEKCEAENISYRLDYNAEGLANKEEYIKLYNDCGWTYIQDYAGYSYFYKKTDGNDNEEIFCDNDSRIMMLERVIKGRMLPLAFTFVCFLMPQCISSFFIYKNYIMSILFGAIIIIYISVFIMCYKKYKNLKKRL